MKREGLIYNVVDFYVRGFKEMTWGRVLWVLIIVKLLILFILFRLIFFQPILAGKSEKEKSQYVGEHLIEKADAQSR